MKKVIKYILTISLLFVFPMIVKANSISNIDIDIYIDENGTGHVTEVWHAYINQGTEGYKPYYNLGNAKITNFKVSDNGVNYTYLNSWNTNATKEQKAYKNGINYISDGLELCFGLSSNGSHKYKLTYDIEGFVSTNDDSDMIYWTLMPHNFSVEPDNVHIKIYSDNKFSNKLSVWGYGYKGTVEVNNGVIEMNSEGVLNSKEYMVLLAKFEKGTFNTYNKISNDFNYYYKMSKQGTIKNWFLNLCKKIIILIIKLLPVVGLVLLMTFPFLAFEIVMKSVEKEKKLMLKKYKYRTYECVCEGNIRLIYETGSKRLPKKISYYRDIPFNHNLFKTFFIAEAYKLNYNMTDIIGAILLKWLLEKKISIRKKIAGLLIKNEETLIVLSDNPKFENQIEEELFILLKEASKDGTLEKYELEKYCYNNISSFESIFENIVYSQIDQLILEGKMNIEKIDGKDEYVVNKELKKDAVILKGFKNFLEDFSRIGEKVPIEVHIWEYYLIYAQILGIADEVVKQFKNLYPELIENNKKIFNYNDIEFIRSVSSSSMKKIIPTSSSSSSYSSSSGSSYSSSSSSSGGGGSFGGGSSGGGGFR